MIMNTKSFDGGPAYPIDRMTAVALVRQRNPDTLDDDAEYLRQINELSAGMSLRDYFATKALQGLLAGERTRSWGQEDLTSESYRFADSMLAARSVK